nr:retrovirus-related Pol polyprotein from transposon TNT 1-94 [Tanacetum cinerariifolium]
MFDSGCSKHMSGNKALLTDYQDIDGGFVAFGGSTKGGKITDRVLVTNPHNKTPYELIIGRPPSISFLRPFGFVVTILNTLDPLGKFDRKVEEGFLVGYKSLDDKARDNTADDAAGKEKVQELVSEYDQALKNVLERMMNQEKEATEQSNNVRKEFQAQFNTASASRTFIPPHDPLMPELENTAEIQTTCIFGNAYDEDDLETNNHSYANESVGVEADFNNMKPSTVVSPIPITIVHSNHPKAQIIGDPMSAVQTKEELLQFKTQKVWTLVDLPYDKKAIGTKWVYRNKKDKREIVIRNKARLVAQEEGIDYDEMDVKSAFLYGTIEEEMMDYGYNFMLTKIHVDNESAICVIKNPVYHSKTKHIKIRHHFIRDSYEKKLIEMVKIHTDNNVVGLLTKAFSSTKTDILENLKEAGTLRYLSLVVPLKKVGDEAVHKELGDIMERASTTASSLEAEQDNEQFWQTAALRTIKDRVMAITGTIDRNVKETKKVYSSTLTKLILRVKKLERTVKTSKVRRKARIVILEDEDAEDPSKQGRSLIEELDMDVDISLVPLHAANQGRKSNDTQVSGQPEDQLGVFSTAKVLADVAEQEEVLEMFKLT